MVGESQNNVAAGLSMPSRLFLSNRWVRLHRRPLSTLALVTRMNPPSTKRVSVATIRSTPEKIKNITAMRRNEKVSKRNRNAKARTKINDDDLHMAKRIGQMVFGSDQKDLSL